jgi:hypothetical protein
MPAPPASTRTCLGACLTLALALALLAACGSGSGAAAPDAGGAPDSGGGQPFVYRSCGPGGAGGDEVGEFRVELGASFTAVSGSIAAGVVPGDLRETVAEAAGCRLLRKRRLACIPACAAEMTCGEAGACIPYPANLGAGAVTIAGLARAVKMNPDPTGKRYWDTTLPHPGFAPAADIRLAAAGGELPAFALAGWGVTALEAPAGDLALQPGAALAVRWQPGPAGPARVQAALAIDQHGVTPATLVCEAPDTGSLDIPASLVDALVAAGASGYPKLALTRQTVDAVTLPPGCVELVVSATVERNLSVPGHVPCRRDTDCPAGRTCDVPRQSCL